MHGQNINLPVCVCLCVPLSVNSPTGQTPQPVCMSVCPTFCQLAYRSDTSTLSVNLPTGQTPQRIFS